MSSKFVLQQEDGTVENGNARGEGAVDLQMSRTQSTQVASGIGAVAFGKNNTASSSYSAVLGGQDNIASTASRATVIGGQGNQSTGTNSISGGNYSSATATCSIALGQTNIASSNFTTISGGLQNTASSLYSTVSGGAQNTASTNTHATVVGGSGNTASGQYSVAGGYSNVASGQGAVALGYDNTASGSNSVAIGNTNTSSGSSSVSIGNNNNSSGTYSVSFGWDNDATNTSSFVSGARAKSYLRGQRSHAPSRDLSVAGVGQAQMSELISLRTDTLTTGATTTLSLDGTGTTNLIIPDGNNRAWNVQVKTVAVVTAITGTATGVSVGDTLMQDDKLLFSKVSGVSSVVGTTSQDFISSTSLGTASMSYSAGASQELALTFTAPTFAGGGSVTMRVVSKVELVEVAF